MNAICWQLRDNHGRLTELFTTRWFDIYKNKSTGEEYIRGESRWLKGQQLIDKDPNFKFIMIHNNDTLSEEDIRKEIMVGVTFK